MNLLFYNFNGSRCNTASAGKRQPSLGAEREWALGAIADNVQVNSIPLDKLMHSTGLGDKHNHRAAAPQLLDAKPQFTNTKPAEDTSKLARDRVPT